MALRRRQAATLSILPAEHAEHAAGLHRGRESAGSEFKSKRPNKALAFCFVVSLIVACGLACGRRDSPQVAFEHADKTFLQGNLKQSQEDAGREYRRLRDSNPEWAWKFRILEAKSVLWRGMYPQVLAILDSPSARPTDKNSLTEILALEGVADARLHRFAEAEEKLQQATQICQVSSEAACGDVIRARGVLAVQHGQIQAAKQFFAQSLQFARSHHDHLLEVTALLNLGLTSLREEHFDEAIDWTDAAYQASTAFSGAEDIAQTALGNLGWAYYNLGDSEKSLDLSLEAEVRATKVGDVIDQLSWTTNAGYVYSGLGDLARAKQSYLKALSLATRVNGTEDIYNALRALALVSVESGELEEARKYADQAIAIARADKNRSDELYPLWIKGLIAARSDDEAEAERIFREVERDQNGNASLKWRAEHGLARLYEDQRARGQCGPANTGQHWPPSRPPDRHCRRNDSRLPLFPTTPPSSAQRLCSFSGSVRGKTDDAPCAGLTTAALALWPTGWACLLRGLLPGRLLCTPGRLLGAREARCSFTGLAKNSPFYG